MATKASAKHPFLPMFVGDFMAATAEWEGEEQALYSLLLMHQWALRHLPIEVVKLARLVKWDIRNFERYWPTVSVKFVQRSVAGFGPRLVNARLEDHRGKSLAISEKRSYVGKMGAAAKWQNDGNSHAEQVANANGEDGNSQTFANGKRNAIHPIPSHPNPSSESHSVADVSGTAKAAGAEAPDRRASKVLKPVVVNGRDSSVPKADRGTRLPEDFALTPARARFATDCGVDPAPTFAIFSDYWRGVAGAKGRKANWDATWRNWCRKESNSRTGRRAGASAADRITWRPTE